MTEKQLTRLHQLEQYAVNMLQNIQLARELEDSADLGLLYPDRKPDRSSALNPQSLSSQLDASPITAALSSFIEDCRSSESKSDLEIARSLQACASAFMSTWYSCDAFDFVRQLLMLADCLENGTDY